MFWKTHQPILAESAPVTIEASAGDGPKKFSIVGYTGGLLATSNYPDGIVIDLAGMDTNRRIVANLDHNKTQRVGHVTAITNDGKSLKLAGILSAATPAREEVIASARDGFEWQASIEATPSKIEAIKAGATVEVNGQSFVGPIQVARKSALHGIAFVSMGADSGTSVSVAASKPEPQLELTFEAWSELHGVEATAMTDKQKAFLQASFDSQSKRPIEAGFDIDEMQNVYEKHVEQIEASIAKNADGLSSEKLKQIQSEAIGAIQNLRANAIEHEHTATRFGVDAIPVFAKFQLNLIRSARPQGPAIQASTRDYMMDQKVLEASLLLRVGRDDLAVKSYGERTVEAASMARITSLVDMCKVMLEAAHQTVPHGGNNAIVNAAFSYTKLPNMLASVTGKTLMAAYQATTENWRMIAQIKPAADFKPQKGIRPSAIENLEELAPDGTIRHGTIGEEATYPWEIDTYAKMLGVTRKDIINDDLGFFDTLSPSMGTAAGRTLNDLFWKVWILGQSSNFFSVANKNLLTTGTALTIENLGKGVTAMRKQVDSKGNTVEMAPNTLCVPPELESIAGPIVRSATVVGGTTVVPVGNPMYGIVKNLVVEPRLSNTNFTGNSAAAWYLAAQTAAESIIVGFLDGNQNPVVEIENAPFDQLGMQMRVVFDFGVALADPKAALKATGAA